MTNPHRGDTEIKVGDKRFTLCFDLNACAKTMERLKINTFQQLAQEGITLSKASMTDLVHILYYGLLRHHSEEFKSPEDVGALDWEFESLALTIAEAIGRALTRKTVPEGGDAGKN